MGVFPSPRSGNPPAWEMTSLAQQLQRLALPQSDPSLLSRDEVASLLFDPKEAATIDRDTAFAIGKLPHRKPCEAFVFWMLLYSLFSCSDPPSSLAVSNVLTYVVRERE